MMQAFLLGLSYGAVCVAYCAPVLVPYLLGEGNRTWRNYAVLLRFLAGRLLGYLLFGIMALQLDFISREDLEKAMNTWVD